MSLQVHIIEAAWTEHKEVLHKIRNTVFIEEQQVPKEIEWDGEDEHSTHFLAINELGQYVGCARLLASGQIGRMAVLQEYRGTGIGAALLQTAVQAGKTLGFDRLYLHAQSYAEDFYRKGGFLPYGSEYAEAGIAHISMEMKLPVTFVPVEKAPVEKVPVKEPTKTTSQIRPQAIGEEKAAPRSEVKPFNGFHDCSTALLRVIQSARRRLLILNPYLDHELFDKAPVASAISELARSAPKVEIHILIFDSKLIVDRGHRIVELARRLDEKIKIQVLSEASSSQSSSFVCADLDGYWLLPSFDKHDGVSDLANAVTCKRLTEAFESAWAKSHPDPELRIMQL